MPSTTVNATYQGVAFKTVDFAQIAWQTQVRNASTATSVTTYTSNTSVSSAVEAALESKRNGYRGRCNRTFLFFDGLDTATGGGTITAATLKVLGGGLDTTVDTIIVEGTAWGSNGSSSTLTTSDYSNLDHSTAYSSKNLSWNTTAYNDFTLNSTAIADMNSNGYLNAVLIEGDYDYDNENPLVGTTTSAGVTFLDATNKIKLELTYTSGYSNNVIGVSNIAEVTGVATANIGKVIGVQ
jgi:hypothetical protein